MPQSIGHIALVVRDYDEAIAFFTQSLGFMLIEDSPSTDRNGQEKRWVLVAPPGSRGNKASTGQGFYTGRGACIGNQTGGRVFLFLHTDDFCRDYRAMTERGVRFLEEPRNEAYGTVAVFEDLYGNKWDLLQLEDGAK